MSKKKIYPNCFKEARHGDSPIGPSTGTALLSTLQDDDTVNSINVFGMNFNGDHIGSFHVDFIDMNLTNICCTKCIFHETINTSWESLKLIAIYAPPGPEDLLRDMAANILPPGSLSNKS